MKEGSCNSHFDEKCNQWLRNLENVGVMHAVVFADRAQEAKSAQVMGRLQNFNGLKKRTNSDRNGQQSDKSK